MSPHGKRLTNTADTLLLGHSKAIPADTQLVNRGEVPDVFDTDMYTCLQVTTEKGPLRLARRMSSRGRLAGIQTEWRCPISSATR
ncbi:MAG: hypothetical protein KKH12_09710 [Gammaproteobacteria bacterium]|nr:hypothetical protein [Gammaproteobacteria bacterium]MBU1481940.1 hypothetical protein [Gammaproteobacteria bacterium]